MFVCLYVIVFCFTSILAEEPLCSSFSYDEALLEKMIRNEIKFEQLQAKVDATLDRLESTLKDIQERNQNMREEFNHFNQTTIIKVGEFMKDSTDVIDQQRIEIGRMSEDLQSLYTDLRKNVTESLSTPIIGFKATGTKNTSPTTGEVLVFPTVQTNSGDGYDASNGVFTAPVDGLYLFTTQMCVSTNKYITASIIVDETEVGRSLTYVNSNTYPCNTGDAIAEVKAGQKVFVKVKALSGNLYSNEHRLISFSGALINKGN